MAFRGGFGGILTQSNTDTDTNRHKKGK